MKFLLKPLFDALNLNMVSARNVEAAIHKRALSIMDEIKKMCANRMISIKLDGATRHSRRVVIVNTQMVVKNKVIIKTIAVRELPVSHTGVKGVSAFCPAKVSEILLVYIFVKVENINKILVNLSLLTTYQFNTNYKSTKDFHHSHFHYITHT